jgi:serine/threonine protein kinase/WD40 repeat protein
MAKARLAPEDGRTESWDRVDRAVKAFEDAWRLGKRPAIDDYVKDATEDRLALLRELALVDLERRLKAGEATRVEAYLRQFAVLAADPPTVLDLITLEYEQRRRKEAVASVRAELLRRFPTHRQALLARLEGEDAAATFIVQKADSATAAPVATQVTQTMAQLVTALRQGQLLKQAHLDKLTDLQHRFQRAADLRSELVKCGWLTPYQAQEIAKGRGGGLLVGPYVLLEPLGAGGMGQVFKARHRLMNRLAAVKLIREESRSSSEYHQRFLREVEAAAQLSHPNIVAAFDAAQHGTSVYLAMEYVEGVDLARLLKAHGPLPVARACDYIRQAAFGLQHAHERGLSHRDVKPSNLLLARGGSVSPERALAPGETHPSLAGTIKVLDLGLARFQLESDDERRLTRVGDVMGTPDYIAPEQVVDTRRADIRSDIYSLGCTLYELLVGRPPFATGSIEEKLLAHQTGQPVALEQVRPEVQPALAQVVRRMMAKRPEDRYQTPGEVAAALVPFGAAPTAIPLRFPPDAAFRASPAPTARSEAVPVVGRTEPTSPPRGRPGRWLWAVVAGGAALVLLSIWFFRPSDQDPDEIDKEESPPPHKVSLLDRLRPQDIPFELRWQGQPKELVAILGAASPHAGQVTCVRFSPDGKYLLTGCNGTTGQNAAARLWNLETVQPVYDVHPSGPVASIALTSDGKRVAAMGTNPRLLAWDLVTGKELFRQTGWRLCYDLHFSRDGRWLLGDQNPPSTGVHQDSTVLILNGATGERHAAFQESKSPFLTSIQLFKDGKTAVSASVKHTSKEPASISFFEVPSGKPIKSWTYKDGGFTQIRLSPDNRYLYGSHEKDGHLWIWDLKQSPPKPIRKPASKTPIRSMAIAPDGHTLFTFAPGESNLVQWAVPAGAKEREWMLPKVTSFFHVLAMAPDGRHLAVGRGDGRILILRLASAKSQSP